MNFLAIDFETANYDRSSACAVGLVRVEGGRVTRRLAPLIRPPHRSFVFTYLHGIGWEDVRREPSFPELWPRISDLFEGIDFLAAHNASFDRSVLEACCREAGIEPPRAPFLCTVRLARRLWGVRPTRLPDVCTHLDIPLEHHEAASDSEACARIVLEGLREDEQAVASLALPRA